MGGCAECVDAFAAGRTCPGWARRPPDGALRLPPHRRAVQAWRPLFLHVQLRPPGSAGVLRAGRTRRRPAGVDRSKRDRGSRRARIRGSCCVDRRGGQRCRYAGRIWTLDERQRSAGDLHPRCRQRRRSRRPSAMGEVRRHRMGERRSRVLLHEISDAWHRAGRRRTLLQHGLPPSSRGSAGARRAHLRKAGRARNRLRR